MISIYIVAIYNVINMNKNILIYLVLSVIIISTSVYAFTISDGRQQFSGLISDGGTSISSDTYKTYLAIGQPIISPETYIDDGAWFGLGADYVVGGNLTDDPPLDTIFGTKYYPDNLANGDQGKYNLCLGVFCTETFTVPHFINMTGRITYDVGGSVANSEAIVKVKYGLASFESEPIETDENGKFDIEFLIPERIAIHPFDIIVYANGRIEAEYICKYNHGTEDCVSY